MHTLAIDIGNTHTVVGLFKDNEFINRFRFQTDRKGTADEIYLQLEQSLARYDFSLKSMGKAVVCSVVPELNNEWELLFHKNDVDFLAAGHSTAWSFNIDLPNPEQIGVDRLANAQAAIRFGAPVIIVDAGTATTIDVVGERRGELAFIGGMICPGVRLGLDALVSRSSQLHSVSLSADDDIPLIGKNTNEALQSGSVHGFCAMVDAMIEKIIEEQNFPDSCQVIATGGFSYLLKGRSKRVQHFEPRLTLDGLNNVSRR